MIGFGGVGIYDKKCQRSILQIDGRIELPKGKTRLGTCAKLVVGKNATLTFGKDFCNTAGMTIICNDRITFGDNVLVSWETMIMDEDWHQLQDTQTGKIHDKHKSISIGDNVWICYRSVILKGTHIPNGCTIAAGAVVSGKFEKENSILAGVPAKTIRSNITRHID